MNSLLSLVDLIPVLGILIYVHELGHFLAAKFFGVRVEVFSLGFGTRLFGFRGKETDYRVSAIPLGGYVRMAGEMDAREAAAPEDPGFFTAKPRWQRLAILFAGPTMNILLALGLWWGMFVHGVETLDIPQGPPVVEQTEPGSPADRAGIQPGDQILAIAGKPVRSLEDYEESKLLRPRQTLTYTIGRGGATLEKTVTLSTHPRFETGWDGIRVRLPVVVESLITPGPAARAGVQPGDRILSIDGRAPSDPASVSKLVNAGGPEIALTLLRGEKEVTLTFAPETGEGGKRQIGVYASFARRFVQYGPLQAARESLHTAWYNAGLLYRTLSALVHREVGLGVMSGPLEIARISREQWKLGLVPFLQLLAFISIQLGIFNLFPIPVLDGGHVLILLVESALRRDVSLKLKERVLQVGFVLLVTFAVAVLAMDVRKAWVRSRSEGASTPKPATPAEAPRR